MKPESKHSYQKRIKELEQRVAELEDDRYTFRTTVLEIFDGIASTETTGLNKNWILQRLRRCIR